MDDLLFLKKQVEQMRQDTVKCPNTTDLYAVVAYDKVLRAIDSSLSVCLTRQKTCLGHGVPTEVSDGSQ